jgi:hypothetical protein
MEKEFIPYEQALVLKELGFDEPCFGYYVGLGDNNEEQFKLLQIQSEKGQFEWTDNVYQAPTYQQAFRWFREKYNIECHIKSLYEQRENKGYYFGIDDYTNRDFYSKPYYSYEEAELECLKKLIEIVKEQK